MTLEKAIRTLEAMRDIEGGPFTSLGKDALRLGIEALKAIQAHRKDFREGSIYSLPGETEE